MNLLEFVKKRYLLLFFLFFLVVGTFLRFYRIRQTMQFLGDQGRDALIARGILIEKDPAFIGPVTSVGNMYLGPFYYYFMVFPLMLTYPDPIGPVLAVAFVGCITLALIYLLGKDLVGKNTAMLAMGLYAVSPVVIENVRFSWNPNIVPFFALLTLWCLHKTLQGKYFYWAWIGLLAAVLSQLHYLTLILIGGAGLVWIYELITMIKAKKLDKQFLVSTGIAIVIFLFSLAPILIYDIKHEFLNTKAFTSFFTGSEDVAKTSHFRRLSDISAVFYAWIALALRNLFEIFGIKIQSSAALISFILLLYIIAKTYLFDRSEAQHRAGKVLLLSMFSVCVLVLAFYKASIFDHYLGFVYPTAILLLATFLMRLWKSIFLKPLVVGIVLVLVFVSLQKYPGQHILGMNVDVFWQTAREIEIRVTPGESYDILLLAQNNDFLGMNYRYFLTTGKQKPATEEEVHSFKKLFVIDEKHQENPLDTPQYKVAIWPNRTITDSFEIPNGPRVVVLER